MRYTFPLPMWRSQHRPARLTLTISSIFSHRTVNSDCCLSANAISHMTEFYAHAQSRTGRPGASYAPFPKEQSDRRFLLSTAAVQDFVHFCCLWIVFSLLLAVGITLVSHCRRHYTWKTVGVWLSSPTPICCATFPVFASCRWHRWRVDWPPLVF